MPRTKKSEMEKNQEQKKQCFFDDDFDSRSHYDSKGKSKHSYYNSIAVDSNDNEHYSLEELIGYQY